MRYVAAYLLASLGGAKAVTADDIKKILGSVGIESDAERANKIVSELAGKNVADVIAAGSLKLASVPSGGGAAAAPAAGGAAGPAGGGSPKKEDKKKEESEEEDDDMGFGLFD